MNVFLGKNESAAYYIKPGPNGTNGGGGKHACNLALVSPVLELNNKYIHTGYFHLISSLAAQLKL